MQSNGKVEPAYRKNIRPYVLKYFIEHPGATVFRDDLINFLRQQTGSKPQEQSIANAIIKMIELGKPIEVDIPGHAWIYRPNGTGSSSAKPAPPKRMFEELAVTKTGDILIQDESGKVYRAVEL